MHRSLQSRCRLSFNSTSGKVATRHSSSDTWGHNSVWAVTYTIISRNTVSLVASSEAKSWHTQGAMPLYPNFVFQKFYPISRLYPILSCPFLIHSILSFIPSPNFILSFPIISLSILFYPNFHPISPYPNLCRRIYYTQTWAHPLSYPISSYSVILYSFQPILQFRIH